MRLSVLIALAALFVATFAAPASASPRTPSTAISKPAGCSTIVYGWSNFRKAGAAQLRIHHFGVFETSRTLVPVGSSGTFAMPADVTFVSGDHYTVLGVLLDGAGRTITPSGAAWWGTC